jgi:hypothetical protein
LQNLISAIKAFRVLELFFEFSRRCNNLSIGVCSGVNCCVKGILISFLSDTKQSSVRPFYNDSFYIVNLEFLSKLYDFLYIHCIVKIYLNRENRGSRANALIPLLPHSLTPLLPYHATLKRETSFIRPSMPSRFLMEISLT